MALKEPDPYLAQAYRFGMLEDFDHLYRYSALYDRLEGKDPNYLIQSYSDIRPGRPTVVEHRHPLDDLRRPYDRRTAHPLSKIHAELITAAEFQTHDFYMTIGPMFADPVARQLYAEIASIGRRTRELSVRACGPRSVPPHPRACRVGFSSGCWFSGWH